MLRRSIELFYLQLIKGQKKGLLMDFLRGVLWCMSGVYWLAICIRNWAYDHNWFRSYYPPVPLVISVGNIVAGGAGKTPVTLMVAEALSEDVTVAILARGYRSQAEKFSNSVVLCKGHGALHPASFCGDEPYLIAQHLPKSIVIVGKNRESSSSLAAKLGAQVIVMDDGMQHRKIARDAEIVVINVHDPFGQGYLLPRGLLRESVKALSRADLLVLNHAENQQLLTELKNQMMHYTSAPIVATTTEVETILGMDGKPVSSLNGKKVGIFCGIAHPEYFRETIESLHAEVVKEYILADHEPLEHRKLVQFAQECQALGAQFIVCTEKDQVKLPTTLHVALPLLWIKMRLKIIDGQANWDNFLTKARSILKHH